MGPVAFVVAWAVLGARKVGYNPIEDHISRLAAQGVAERAPMTAGFITFGVALPLYAVALRNAIGGKAWLAATATGLATLGVAAFPLDGPAGDAAHAVAAGAGYATLAALPLVAAAPLARAGQMGWARSSWVAGGASAACLLATMAGPATGLMQRLGLTIGDVWVVASAVALLRGRFGPPATASLPQPDAGGDTL